MLDRWVCPVFRDQWDRAGTLASKENQAKSDYRAPAVCEDVSAPPAGTGVGAGQGATESEACLGHLARRDTTASGACLVFPGRRVTEVSRAPPASVDCPAMRACPERPAPLEWPACLEKWDLAVSWDQEGFQEFLDLLESQAVKAVLEGRAMMEPLANPVLLARLDQQDRSEDLVPKASLVHQALLALKARTACQASQVKTDYRASTETREYQGQKATKAPSEFKVK